MKKLLFIFGLLVTVFCSNSIFAQTNVSGIISSNTNWTTSGSPYVVTGNIMVSNGYTLTIDPGVVVKFDSTKSLQINGALIAKGTSNNTITFTSNKTVPDSGDWGYIYFSDASTDAIFDGQGNYLGGSILEYCTVEYAGNGANILGAVQISSAHPFINYCTIRNNSKSGIYASGLADTLRITNNKIYNNSRYCLDGDGGGGIYTSGGTTIITNNNIYGNSSTFHGDGGGIYTVDGTPVIINNTINNNVAAYNGGAVYVFNGNSAIIQNNIIMEDSASMEFGGIYTLYGTATISHNIIYKNGGGIMIYYGGATITGNMIIGNTAPYAGGGVYIRSAAATISNNIISNNSVNPSSFSGYFGAGICLTDYYTGMSVTITKNSIIRNSAQSAPAVDYSVSYAGSYNEAFQYNLITGNVATNSNNTYTNRLLYLPPINYNNIFNNTASYSLYNDNGNSTTLDATNNYWGTADDAQIQNLIYDWNDDGSLGLVNYTPFLTAMDTLAPVSPPANVVKKDIGGGQIELTWNHNPESDIAGYHIYYGSFNGLSASHMIDAGNDTSYILSGVTINDTIGVTAYDRTYNAANEDNSTIVNDNMTNANESWFTLAVNSNATGIEQGENNIPVVFRLFQNFPNPFNPTTQIQYEIPRASFVQLTVFNILGQKIAELVNGQQAPGRYSVSFNGANLASGIYLYRLQAGDFVQTKKLILMK